MAQETPDLTARSGQGLLDLPDSIGDLPAVCRSYSLEEIGTCITVLALKLQLASEGTAEPSDATQGEEGPGLPDVCQLILSDAERRDGKIPDATSCAIYLAGRVKTLDEAMKNLLERLPGRSEENGLVCADPEECPAPGLTPTALCDALDRQLAARAEAGSNSGFDMAACAADPMAELRRAMKADRRAEQDEGASSGSAEVAGRPASAGETCTPPDAVALRMLIQNSPEVFGGLPTIQQNLLVNFLSQGTPLDAALERVWPAELDREGASSLLCGTFAELCVRRSCP